MHSFLCLFCQILPPFILDLKHINETLSYLIIRNNDTGEEQIKIVDVILFVQDEMQFSNTCLLVLGGVTGFVEMVDMDQEQEPHHCTSIL